MALLVLFLSYLYKITFFPASGKHLETSCRAFAACAMLSTGILRGLAQEIYATLHFSTAALF
jgi:hypothetical protein